MTVFSITHNSHTRCLPTVHKLTSAGILLGLALASMVAQTQPSVLPETFCNISLSEETADIDGARMVVMDNDVLYQEAAGEFQEPVLVPAEWSKDRKSLTFTAEQYASATTYRARVAKVGLSLLAKEEKTAFTLKRSNQCL